MLSTGATELKWLLLQLRPHLRLHILTLLCSVAASALVAVEPLLIKSLIDDVLPRQHHTAELLAYTGGVLLITLTYHGLHGLARMHRAIAAERLAGRLRHDLFSLIDRLPGTYHVTLSPGDTVYRLEQDLDKVKEFAGTALLQIATVVGTATLSVIAMWNLEWRLTVAMLSMLPLLVFVNAYFQPLLKGLSHDAQHRHAERAAFLQEHVLHLRQVQVLACFKFQARRFARRVNNSVRAELKRKRTELLLAVVSAATFGLATSMVLCCGGYQVQRGVLSVGALVAFYAYLGRLLAPADTLVQTYSQMQQTSASVRRIMDLISACEPPDRVTSVSPARSDSVGAITVRNVSLAYDQDRPALHGISLQIAAGEKVALIGPNGSGKSTLTQILVGLLKPQIGQLWLGGRPVETFGRKALRSVIALVPQQPAMFATSVRENVLCGNPAASEVVIEAAAAIAQLEPLLREFPHGWNEQVGHGGSRLSTGQAQRLALARALLRNPAILILDEATSAVDGPTEDRILSGLRALVSTTIIAIAHQTSIMHWADRIIVLERGAVLTEGRHEDLYRHSTLYRSLYDCQRAREHVLDNLGVGR